MPDLSIANSGHGDGLTGSRRRILLLTLTMTSSLGMVASTIYVPSIPAIAGAFETSIPRVQLSFVGYLLAFAASMLVLGPLSDRYGRRRTILFGLAVSALSSVACAVSPTIEFLIGARIVQGVGACAGLVVGRAITRELWGREAAAQVIAGRAIAATLMQAFAPVVGGYLQEWFGWRSNFAFIAVLAGIAMLLVLRNVPGERKEVVSGLPLRGILESYQTLIKTPRFMSYAFT
ncbi:MAG: MFS transporter, partial [Alphaproteobacteria bacterium]|nr:MFS transporter [Alphaproteobacteria bacterium]